MTSRHLETFMKKTQDEIRRLMAERRKKDPSQCKINNPLAKFNAAGQLTCILCSSVIKYQHLWPVHVNGKVHKENIAKAKEFKESTQNFTAPVNKHKNSCPPDNPPPEKKLKGILKNSNHRYTPPTAATSTASTSTEAVPHDNEEMKKLSLNMAQLSNSESVSDPAKEGHDAKGQLPNDQPIPEGFFDDPVMDAKARNIEYKDVFEDEWEKFLKEIKEEASASAEIIADEQMEATVTRQIEEIDEQMRNWNRVMELEAKKEETQKKTQENEQLFEEHESHSDYDEDFDEFLDWRLKQS